MTGFVSDNEVLVDDGVAVAVLTNHMASGASEIAQLVAGAVASSGKQADAERLTLAMYRDLQRGQVDRGLLASNLSDYLSDEAVKDFASSLGPLGEPLTFQQVRESLRGGMTFRAFRVVYPGKRLTVTTYTYPDGKLEQFLVEPAE